MEEQKKNQFKEIKAILFSNIYEIESIRDDIIFLRDTRYKTYKFNIGIYKSELKKYLEQKED